jgi:flagellar biosynthesis protein
MTHDDISKNRANLTAVALSAPDKLASTTRILAAGRGVWAEKILDAAFEHDIKVRTDPMLADMLAQVELDSPIPSEAIMAVAEVLSYVYAAQNNNVENIADEIDVEP